MSSHRKNLKNRLNIFFRVDASETIGGGHFFRCISIAAALKKRGHLCSFICQEINNNFLSILEYHSFELIYLPKNSLISDKDQLKEASYLTEKIKMNKMHIDVLFVDVYKINAVWEEKIKTSTDKLFAIDDLANRGHYVDYIIDQNAGRTEADYKLHNLNHGKILSGTRFAIINQDIADYRDKALSIRKKINNKNILINFGSSSHESLYSQFIKSLISNGDMQGKSISLLSSNKTSNEFKDLLDSLKVRLLTSLSPIELAKLYISSDFCIGAGGVSALERCCLGLPSGVVCIAENQYPGSVQLEKKGCIKLLNNFPDLTVSINIIKNLLNDDNQLKELSINSFNEVDGNGLKRILSEVESA